MVNKAYSNLLHRSIIDRYMDGFLANKTFNHLRLQTLLRYNFKKYKARKAAKKKKKKGKGKKKKKTKKVDLGGTKVGVTADGMVDISIQDANVQEIGESSMLDDPRAERGSDEEDDEEKGSDGADKEDGEDVDEGDN